MMIKIISMSLLVLQQCNDVKLQCSPPALTLYQEPFSDSSSCSRPSTRVIHHLDQSRPSPKSLRHAAYKNCLSFSSIGKGLSSQELIYGYFGVSKATQTHRWTISVTS